MNFVIGDRRSGKTTKIIEEMRKYQGSVMICSSERRARDLDFEHREELGPDRFVSYDYARDHLRGRRPTNVYLDDLEIFLIFLFHPHAIGLVTATGSAERICEDLDASYYRRKIAKLQGEINELRQQMNEMGPRDRT